MWEKVFSHVGKAHLTCFWFDMQRTVPCIFATALLIMEFEMMILVMLYLWRHIFTAEFSSGRPRLQPLALYPPFPFSSSSSWAFSHHCTGTFHRCLYTQTVRTGILKLPSKKTQNQTPETKPTPVRGHSCLLEHWSKLQFVKFKAVNY